MYKNSNLIKIYIIRGDALYWLVCNQNLVKAPTVSRHVSSYNNISNLRRNFEAKISTFNAKSSGCNQIISIDWSTF